MYDHFSLIRNNCDVTKYVISTKTKGLSFCQLLRYTEKFNKKICAYECKTKIENQYYVCLKRMLW